MKYGYVPIDLEKEGLRDARVRVRRLDIARVRRSSVAEKTQRFSAKERSRTVEHSIL